MSIQPTLGMHAILNAYNLLQDDLNTRRSISIPTSRHIDRLLTHSSNLPHDLSVIFLLWASLLGGFLAAEIRKGINRYMALQHAGPLVIQV